MAMSLINSMLRELDARQPGAAANAAMENQVRTVPAKRSLRPAWLLAACAPVVLAAGLGWHWMQSSVQQPAAPVVKPAPAMVKQAPVEVKPTAEMNRTAAVPAASAQAPVEAPAAQAADAKPAQPTEAARSTPATPSAAVIQAPTAPAAMEKADAAHAAPALPAAVAAAPNAKAVATAPAPAKPTAPIPLPAKPPAAAASAMPADAPKSGAGKASVPEHPAAPAEKAQAARAAPPEKAQPDADAASEPVPMPQSVEGLQRLLQEQPRNAALQSALVGALLDAGRRDEAMRVARDALSRDAAQPALAVTLARMQVDRGELQSAIATLEKSLPQGAERADYQAFLAALLQRDGQHQRAAQHYAAALSQSPQNGVWWLGMGISLQAMQRQGEALEAFRRAKAAGGLNPELLAFVNGKIEQLGR
jgi:MSHA biogenesis protein MshN